jgi:hypothetical protein
VIQVLLAILEQKVTQELFFTMVQLNQHSPQLE